MPQSLEEMMALSERDQKLLFDRLKSIRSIAKNAHYASQYQAGPARIAITAGIDLKSATSLHTSYWELNWGWKEVAKHQTTKVVNDQLWLKNPINGFYYTLRKTHDIGSTLVQGTASYVFDVWLGYILEEREQLTGQFHDEAIWCIREGYEEKCTALLRYAIDKVNKDLKLNRELDIHIQYGKAYSEIH